MTRLEVKGLRAGYGPVEIIHGIDLEVREGEVVAIIGPNGSGKSTLLKSVVGLTNVFGGSIKLDGLELVGMKTEDVARAGIAFTPQVDNVFTGLTVEENLELGGYSINDKELLARKMAEVNQVFHEIQPFMKKRAGLMSGGERQMLAIARAMMATPRLMMLDEPTANLSPKASSAVAEKVRAIKAAGIPVIIVEQNVSFALKLADRVCVLVSGVKTYEGSPKELMTLDLQQVFLGLKTGRGAQREGP
ncbi:MAG: ABC transporter ATP-binding protein [Candidatus Caldarchaeum sp.]